MIHFDFQRTPLRTMHRAVDELSESLASRGPIVVAQPAPHAQLNKEQRVFLSTAVKVSENGQKFAPPHFLWGPPGTGKTTTVVHTVLAILKKQPSAKILLTAPSNPAADLLCERIGAHCTCYPQETALCKDSFNCPFKSSGGFALRENWCTLYLLSSRNSPLQRFF